MVSDGVRSALVCSTRILASITRFLLSVLLQSRVSRTRFSNHNGNIGGPEYVSQSSTDVVPLDGPETIPVPERKRRATRPKVTMFPSEATCDSDEEATIPKVRMLPSEPTFESDEEERAQPEVTLTVERKQSGPYDNNIYETALVEADYSDLDTNNLDDFRPPTPDQFRTPSPEQDYAEVMDSDDDPPADYEDVEAADYQRIGVVDSKL